MKIVAIQTVKSGGKYHAPGDVFEVDDKLAEELEATGAAEPATAKSKTKPTA